MRWNRHVYVSGTENRVCFMAHGDGKQDDVDEANARLISAAPDLLEACIEFASLECTDLDDIDELNRVFGLCRAALAKAIGYSS